MDAVRARLLKVLALTDALAVDLSAEALASHNGKAPSNTIGAQFWCIVGARESYTAHSITAPGRALPAA